ncbi:MAG: T9SS type A sorting domain-containing protein [bacterium]|nr:T9SS type A sorting domain-containing protein [bacterium]
MRRRSSPAAMATMCLLLLAGGAWAQSLTLEGTLNLAGRTAIDAVGRYAYVGATGNLSVVDVNNPGGPVLRGQLAVSGEVNAISMAGNYAFLAAGLGQLFIVNIAVPTAPTWAGSLSLDAACLGVSAHDTLAAVATQTQVVLVGARTPSAMDVLDTYTCAARWIEFDSDPNFLHVGTTGGVLRLEIVRHVSGGDTTLELELDDTYGGSLFSPVELASPFVNAVNQATLTAIHVSTYTLAGQYTAPAAIRALAGGSGFCFAALANGSVYYLDQRQNTPQFVDGAAVPGTPAGAALAEAGATPLVVVAHSTGVSVLSYDPLSASEIPNAPLPRELSLQAYPNPFNAAVELRLTAPAPGRYALHVFDPLGREIESRTLNLAAGIAIETLDFHRRSSGIYFARLDGPSSRATIKLVYLP